MADNRIDFIALEINSPGFEIKPGLLAEVLLDAIGPILFGPQTCSPFRTSQDITEPTPRT
jgi:hypothetical protein